MRMIVLAMVDVKVAFAHRLPGCVFLVLLELVHTRILWPCSHRAKVSNDLPHQWDHVPAWRHLRCQLPRDRHTPPRALLGSGQESPGSYDSVAVAYQCATCEYKD